MKKILLIVFAIMAIKINAQIYTQFDVGYGFSLIHSDLSQRYIYDANINFYQNDNEVQKIDIEAYRKNINISNGLFLANETGYILKNKFGFSIHTSYFNNYLLEMNRVTTVHNLHSYRNDTLFEQTKKSFDYYGSQLNISPQISVYFNFNKFSYSISLGYTMSYVKVYLIEESNAKITNSPLYTYSYTKEIEYTDKMNSTITLSNSLLYKFSDNFQGIISISFTPLSFEPSKATQTYYKKENTAENGFVVEPIIETQPSEEKMNEKIVFDYSNLNISFGIRYNFGKKGKQIIE